MLLEHPLWSFLPHDGLARRHRGSWSPLQLSRGELEMGNLVILVEKVVSGKPVIMTPLQGKCGRTMEREVDVALMWQQLWWGVDHYTCS
ncbi:hypothetical protein Tco_0386808 [Tanacetum coccineum]